MDWIDIALLATKSFGALLGGVLTLVGIFHEPDKRRKEASLTRTRIIIAIAISAGLALLASVLETVKSKYDSDQQTARTESLLFQISRAIQPITEIRIRFVVEFSKGGRALDAYSKFLEREIGAIESQHVKQTIDWERHGLGVSFYALSGRPLWVDIRKSSRLWPKGNHAFLDKFVGDLYLGLGLTKNPQSKNDRTLLLFEDDLVANGRLEHDTFSYSPEQKRVIVWGTAFFPKEGWRSNGRLSSIVDLNGAQLTLRWVHLPENLSSLSPDEEKTFDGMQIIFLTLQVADGRVIVFEKNDFVVERGFLGMNLTINIKLPSQ